MAAAPEPYETYIQQAAASYGIPAALLRELVRAESGFDPSALSPAGAEGIAQFTPATAQSLGVNPWDPRSSINGAAQLLAQYLRTFGGSVSDALAAYNAGPGAVQRYGGVPPYSETQSYVSRIEQASGVSGTVTPGASGGAQNVLSLGDLNPSTLAGDVVNGLVGKLGDLAWSIGRPLLVTGALVAVGGVLVALGLWRAVQQELPKRPEPIDLLTGGS